MRRRGADDPEAQAVRMAPPLPRLLVIDPTRIGAMNATGQFKSALMSGWSSDDFRQVWAPAGEHGPLALAESIFERPIDAESRPDEAILSAIEAFAPEVILYRPVIDQNPTLHRLAMEVLDRHQVPLVTQIVDDWPARAAARDPRLGAELQEDLERLFSRSRLALSISEKMSDVLGARYGVGFAEFANAVDIEVFERARGAAAAEKDARDSIVFRYCGALAPDMTFDSVLDVATAIERVGADLPVSLEIYTAPLWGKPFARAARKMRRTTIHESVADADYPRLLAGADALVLGYNFDAASLLYIGLSMPNKLPEYLASAAPVLAVGPPEANGIDYLTKNGLGLTVLERDPAAIEEAVRRLATDAGLRLEIGTRGSDWASENLVRDRTAERFERLVAAAADGSRPPILGPLPRDRHASVDETHAVARLLSERARPGVMLDVGAHHGSSLAPFVESGWSVFAFEPDSANREQLESGYSHHSGLVIDPRAVSDRAAEDVAFFASGESTGISALHAFRSTHRESGRVAVTTVEAIVDEHRLTEIDFLKVDVEGHDWSVLRGVPWDRVTPRVIECEFEDAKTVPLGHTHRDLCDYLVDRGYTVYVSEWHPIVRYGIRHDWRQLIQYPQLPQSVRAWGNVMAFADDPGEASLRSAFDAELTTGAGSAPALRHSGGEAHRPARGGGRETLARVDASGPSTRPSDRCFVLGNGPSLRDVELERLTDVATIGMNAAYRVWDRIGWYPTHYTCLDDELIATHHEAIARLLAEDRVESAFVTARVLDFQPHLVDDDRCFFLEQVTKHWHIHRGIKWGIELGEFPAFQTPREDKMTTGGYAVRYAIHLGFSEIYLLGIDCNYVERVEGSSEAGGTALRMDSTPDRNPNYFFDDYQQAGDRFNVPNPPEHGGNLHLQALEAVRDDVVEQELPVRIANCAPESQLSIQGVFPFEELDRALGYPRLGAVAVPMTAREEDDFVRNLRLWSEPARRPVLPSANTYAVPLVAVLNGSRDPALEERLTSAFEECPLDHSFSRIDFVYCEIDADEDHYITDYSRPVPKSGFKAGPNAQFFAGIDRLRDYGRYVFMMETDCLPVRPDWLGELERRVDGAEPFWILGSLYRGVGKLNQRWRSHLNGNAVYAAGDPNFRRFVAEEWRPSLEGLIEELPYLAYDCVFPMRFADGDEQAEGWDLEQRIGHLFRASDYIQNLAGEAETKRGEGASLETVIEASPRTYVVHGRHLFPHSEVPRPSVPRAVTAAKPPSAVSPPPLAVPPRPALRDADRPVETSASSAKPPAPRPTAPVARAEPSAPIDPPAAANPAGSSSPAMTTEPASDLSLYDRLYVRGRDRGGPLFAAARLFAWCGRKARHHPLLVLATLVVLALPITFAALADGDAAAPLWALSALMLAVAAAVALAGFVRFNVKQLRHELSESQVAARRRTEDLERAQREVGGRLRAASEADARQTDDQRRLEVRLAAAERSLGTLGRQRAESARELEQVSTAVEAGATTQARIDRELERVSATLEAGATTQARIERAAARLRTRVDEIGDRPDRALELAEELGGRLREIEAREAERAAELRSSLDRVEAIQASTRSVTQSSEEAARETRAHLERIDARLRAGLTAQKAIRLELDSAAQGLAGLRESVGERGELEARIAGVESRAAATDALARVSLDVVSALRQVRPLYARKGDRAPLDLAQEAEHGHALLLALMVEDGKASPGSLVGRRLVEIGTTRESDPNQRSTEKLAIFTGIARMQFVTVDMDPLNTAAANRTIAHLNPYARAVTERGESFLSATDERIDYAYLDGFDYDHGQHSEARQERYRSILGTQISDEQCWEMHLVCAAALVANMPVGGVVVIDDTWVENNEYVGKGRRAVPLLLATGFEVVARTREAVGLRRRSAGS